MVCQRGCCPTVSANRGPAGRRFALGVAGVNRATTSRRRGGIEPLHVSMPRELKSRPSTSPTHPGLGAAGSLFRLFALQCHCGRHARQRSHRRQLTCRWPQSSISCAAFCLPCPGCQTGHCSMPRPLARPSLRCNRPAAALSRSGWVLAVGRGDMASRRGTKSPATRNRTRDHLIAARLYSQMLYQLSYRRLVERSMQWRPSPPCKAPGQGLAPCVGVAAEANVAFRSRGLSARRRNNDAQEASPAVSNCGTHAAGYWSQVSHCMRPCGLMDKALVFRTKDCRFESCQGHLLLGVPSRHATPAVAHGAANLPGSSGLATAAAAVAPHTAEQFRHVPLPASPLPAGIGHWPAPPAMQSASCGLAPFEWRSATCTWPNGVGGKHGDPELSQAFRPR